MVKKHLIKRTSKLTDKNQFNHQLKDGWYSETKIGGKPTGHSAKKGDIVYIAESGFAIFGHGIIRDIITTEIISYNSLMNYILFIYTNEHKIYCIVRYFNFNSNCFYSYYNL